MATEQSQPTGHWQFGLRGLLLTVFGLAAGLATVGPVLLVVLVFSAGFLMPVAVGMLWTRDSSTVINQVGAFVSGFLTALILECLVVVCVLFVLFHVMPFVERIASLP